MNVLPPTTCDLTARQQEISDAIATRRKGGMDAPFAAMLCAPEIADRVQLLDEHLRFGLRLPERLRALAILVTATCHRIEDATYFSGLSLIRDAGLSAEKREALTAGRKPGDLNEAEALVYRFASELAEMGRVRTPTFEEAARTLGRDVVIELIGVCGHTAMLVVMLNVTRTRFADS